MFSSLISNIFKKNKNSLIVPDSILVKKLQEFAEENSLYVFKDAKIFHHAELLEIPLLIIDPKRGIYIFEYKTWCYNEIKHLKVSKSSHESSSEHSLAFETKHDFIQKRFNEVLNNDGVSIFNFVLMENLTKNEFQMLDSSFEELIPSSKTLFSTDPHSKIMTKLFNASDEQTSILDINSIISTLFVQNTIVDTDNSIKITSKEQNEIIDHDFSGINHISCKNASGATTTILLKAIYEHLQHKNKNIYIVQPTNIACELLKQKLLNTIEHSIVEIDFSKILIVTPDYVKNKKFDLILIDNASMLDKTFIDKVILLNKNTIIFDDDPSDSTEYVFSLTNNYRNEVTIETLHGNPYAITFVNIQRLLNSGIDTKDILIVAKDAKEENNILEDLCQFIEGTTVILNPLETINTQELDNILLAKYDELFGFSRNYVFLFNPKDIENNVHNFLFSRAIKKTFVIYDEEKDQLGNRDAKDIQNEPRVEDATITAGL
ncbi:hypothetical protein KKA17_03590 [bacterium]|nr:hypothetical protein [bacterium]MBU1883390.1 hypothetical protein [bacterium]